MILFGDNVDPEQWRVSESLNRAVPSDCYGLGDGTYMLVVEQTAEIVVVATESDDDLTHTAFVDDYETFDSVRFGDDHPPVAGDDIDIPEAFPNIDNTWYAWEFRDISNVSFLERAEYSGQLKNRHAPL